MRRSIRVGGWLLLIAAVGALVLETRRLAELAGRYEVEARQARERAARPSAAASALPKDAVVPAPVSEAPPAADAPIADATLPDALAHARLQLDLLACKAQLQAVTEMLQQRNEEQQQRVLAAAARAEALEPMPEGVRLCLQTLHDRLRAEGFAGPRFLVAARVDGEGLHDVELLETDPDGLQVSFLRAARMTATVDRGQGRLDLRFFDGFRSVGADRTPLPADGFVLEFRDIDGRAFEQQLPYLVRAEGVYPAPAAEPPPPVDAATRRQWLLRLERTLNDAGTALRWRPSRCRGMQDGWFLTAELVGTDAKNHVLGAVHCERMAVEVDAATGVVSLLLRSGSLRQAGIESTITDEGYRMLLPNLTPKQASDAMLGMVVHR